MIKAKNPLFNLTCLLAGGIVLLFTPVWLISTLSLGGALILVFIWAHNHPQLWRLTWQFCVEFLGFCLLVGLFVSMLAFFGSGLI